MPLRASNSVPAITVASAAPSITGAVLSPPDAAPFEQAATDTVHVSVISIATNFFLILIPSFILFGS